MGQLFFKKQFQLDIRAGRKRTTIRRWNKPCVRVGRDAFSPGLGWLAIERVEPVDLTALGEDDARADGFDTTADLCKTLRDLYPDQATDGKQWFRVAFHLLTPPPDATAAKAPKKSKRNSTSDQKSLWT